MAERKPCPDFNLAPLHQLPREVFALKGHNALDAFVLSLAVAYNDLKGIFWLHQQLHTCKPEDTAAISGEAGQWNGMRVQATRMIFAIGHEILHAIARAFDQGLLQRKEFRDAVRKLKPESQAAWKRLVRAARGKGNDGLLRKYMRTVRNTAVYHYDQWPEMLDGYQRFFVGTTERNSSAYLSVGRTMEQTRFYFADAVVQQMFAGTPDLEEMFRRANDLVDVLHVGIVGILDSFLWARSRERNK